MFKMIVHVTQSFETEAQAANAYDVIRRELRKHPDLHVNCQITKKFTGYSPDNPDGHEVEA